ncbi:hypothetical protein D3C86_1090890 [compost metagenome]
MMRGGVMMATNMASMCCRAANRVWGRGGTSSDKHGEHVLKGGEQGLGQGWDFVDAVDEFAVGSPGGVGLWGRTHGGSLFHKYL